MTEHQPLCRNIDTDRIYRVNTGSNKLLRCLSPEFNTLNLGCFVPQYPLWTEGNSYAVGDIVFGRTESPPGVVRVCGVFESRISHTATVDNAPSANSSWSVCQVGTTLHWRALGTTRLLEYPTCSSLADGSAHPYGGLNRSPTGVLIQLSGISQPDPHYVDVHNQWHHDYNGVYCLPAMYGYSGGAWWIGGVMDGDLSWTLEFDPTLQWGDCEEGTRRMAIINRKRSISDNWWQSSYIFCGSHEINLCETNYSSSNLFPPKPYPMPGGTPEYNAWLQSLVPARECCCPQYESWQWPSYCGHDGTLSFLGFTDYMTVRYDNYNVEYSNNGKTVNARWRFALFGSAGKRVILKNNIVCDFFRYDFQGGDWDVFLGCTTIPLTPDADGWFEYTQTVPDGVTVSDFGITNINAYNWRYKATTSDILGSIWNN